MAQRSVIVVFDNQTSQDLVLSAFNVPHGTPVGGGPPQNIGPNSSVTWEVDSSGFATGVEFSVIYHFQSNSSQLVSMNCDNPFVGTSSYTGSGPTGYSLTNSVTGGNNATVTYILTAS